MSYNDSVQTPATIRLKWMTAFASYEQRKRSTTLCAFNCKKKRSTTVRV